jgi:hypothetical protein
MESRCNTTLYSVEKVDLVCDFLSETKFHGNSASVTVQKPFKIELSKWGEEYVSNKAFPDMWVKNVILGTKRIVWEGELIITCAKTGMDTRISVPNSTLGLRAVLTYKEEVNFYIFVTQYQTGLVLSKYSLWEN